LESHGRNGIGKVLMRGGKEGRRKTNEKRIALGRMMVFGVGPERKKETKGNKK